MNKNQYNTVEKILRVAVFLTFIGHGLLAYSIKESWLLYLETVGITDELAQTVIRIIGLIDLLVGTIVLLKPNKYVVLWCFFWAFLTALMRPISGESIVEFIERGANWGAPLALYFLLKRKNN